MAISISKMTSSGTTRSCQKFCQNFNVVQRKGWNWCLSVSGGRATRSCETSSWPSSVVRNGSSSRTQFLPKRPRQLRSGCGGTFWPSSVLRIGPRGLQTSNSWTLNCGLFWRTWHAESITTAWRGWGDPLWRQRQRYPCRRSVRRQQSGQSISRLASRHRAVIWSDIITNENLKLSQINYMARKVSVLFNFPSRSHCTCNRTYGKT